MKITEAVRRRGCSEGSVSGEHTRLACWFRRLAETNFVDLPAHSRITNHESPITIHDSRFTIRSCSLLDGDGDAAFHFLREADDVPIRESNTAMAD